MGKLTRAEEAYAAARNLIVCDETLPIVRAAFTAEDVLSVRSDIGEVSDAEDFLHENRKYIEEAMCAAGFEAIEALWFTKETLL